MGEHRNAIDEAKYAHACITIAWTSITTALCSQVTDEEVALLEQARALALKAMESAAARSRHDGMSREGGETAA